MVEKGTHAELMAQPDGAYAALANMQLSAHAQAAAAKAPDRRGSVLEIAQEAAELGKLAMADSAAPQESQVNHMLRPSFLGV